MKNLVIVESPAKAKTIQKYLGKDYEVIASMGHVRDLPKSKMGIDIENDFEPQYINMRDKSKVIKELKAAAKGKDQIYLAPDPDREGEAIAWHLSNLLGIEPGQKNRVTFNEITKAGVTNGMSNPRTIDMDLVDAQQGRRILDRLVGYQLSPFLWRKVRKGLSAGRVQSVAVRMICDREEAIRNFVPEEFWTIDALLQKDGKVFASSFYGDPKKRKLLKQDETEALVSAIQQESFVIEKVKKGERQKNAAPPFITSTLQQEASRKLGFQARRTMKTAQELYEGVKLPDVGETGLITYMRTDSLRISDEAYENTKTFIFDKYGEKYLPPERRVFKTKKGAQDGHEAIRPTMVDKTPDSIKDSLTADQFKLYSLVWKRFVASQMANAILDTVSAEIHAGKYVFKSSGYTVRIDGFTVLYEEGKDEEEEDRSALPPLFEGDSLGVKELKGNQHFTQPPARFTEASLIKVLEENEIGRPSTYAPTITTITSRGYVEREGKALKPTELGEIVNGLMEEQFPKIVDEKFTANMEKDLDKVEEGDLKWKTLIGDFYYPFKENLDQAEKNMEGKHLKVPDEETDEVCELCGKPMVIKMGRFGKFMACSGFPDCRNTKKIIKETGGICPKCGGRIIAKTSKKGRAFYGCENYPECDFATWDTPLKELCPKCGKTLFKKNGKNGKIYCLNEQCDYERALDEEK